MSEIYNEPEDLLSDESFLSWYHKTGGQGDGDWGTWMDGNAGRARLVRQAITLLETTRLTENPLPAIQLITAEQNLLQKLEALPVDAAPASFTLPLYNWRRWMTAAAVLLVLVTGVILTTHYADRTQQIATGYGQLGQQQLPDGTEVMMDANSNLRYFGNWKENVDREVWVKGEAFFHVRKTSRRTRFIVHMDHFDVVVTGTKFNVVNRNGIENVLLEEGSIFLLSKDGKQLTLHPGEFVSFSKTWWEKKAVMPDSLLAWKEQKLVFDKTPLRQLVTIINDHYGVKIKLDNASTGDKTISAILPNNNLDVLLQALEATSEFKIMKDDSNQITIKALQAQN
jgi:ferric-dicitrate binding protein FerR (iron transport regulator)